MYGRNIKIIPNKSYFLLGPRGTGKSSWLRMTYPESDYINLLVDQTYTELLANPDRLETYINNPQKIILIDEIQKVPNLLNTVHRLIEEKKYNFLLTGSSARKLRSKGVNLLAGRAYSKNFHPLTILELKADFNLNFSLEFGFLPAIFSEPSPKDYLKSYVATYLKEEVLQEGLVRNLSGFARFLEAASFSQGSVLNITNVAAECAVERKVVTNYFTLLEDLLIACRLPVFTRKAQRKLISHPKFYFFDSGVYRAIRPLGPLDHNSEIEGIALETLVFQQLKAINDNQDLGYQIFFWQTREKQEVDFVLYGERGFHAIEVKRATTYRSGDLEGLKLFKQDYPQAKAYLLYLGTEMRNESGVTIMPVAKFLNETLGII